MSKLLNEIKNTIKNKVLEESFKSDDGVSEVPDPALDKSAPATKLKQVKEKEDDAEKNKKLEAKKGNADSENKDDIKHKKLKQVNEADEDEDDDDGATDVDDSDTEGKEVTIKKPSDADSDEENDDDSNSDSDDDNSEVDIKVRKVTKEDIDVAEHLAALFGKEDLSEEFKNRVKSIFETAVVAASNEVISEVVEQILEQNEADQEVFVEGMIDKMDSYLDKVVTDWIEENRVEIQSNVRTEIAESFLIGLKNLFEEHYIDIPDEKVDIVEQLVAKLESVEATLNEEINKNVDLQAELVEVKKEALLAEHFDGLSDNQKERLRMLSESVDFENADDFGTQIEELKESYFNTEVKTNSVDADDEPVILTEEVSSKEKLANPIGFAIAASITKNSRKNR
jgi:hypothetical protein